MSKLALAIRGVITFLGVAAYLALAVFAYGGFRPFFSHPPFVALTIAFFIIAVIALFAGGNMSPGVKEDRGNRWVIPALTILGLLAAYFAPYTDRIGFWTIGGGDAVRWLGVALGAGGSLLRIVPVYILGDRFSGLVAIQPGHRLVTTGLYARLRNPSYLGLLIASLGWDLVFLSGVGLLLSAPLVPIIVARMHSEEKLLQSQFGAEYAAYRAHSWRLIPFVY